MDVVALVEKRCPSTRRAQPLSGFFVEGELVGDRPDPIYRGVENVDPQKHRAPQSSRSVPEIGELFHAVPIEERDRVLHTLWCTRIDVRGKPRAKADV